MNKPWWRWSSGYGPPNIGLDKLPTQVSPSSNASNHEHTSQTFLHEQPKPVGGDDIGTEIQDAINGQISDDTILDRRSRERTEATSCKTTPVQPEGGTDHTNKDEGHTSRHEFSMRKFDELDSHRMDVLTMREYCRQQRADLTVQRQSIERLDQNILGQLYLWRTNPNTANYNEFAQTLEALTLARESLQTASDTYQQLEINLNRKEWELKEGEATFYRQILPAQTRAFAASEDGSVASEDPISDALLTNPSWEGLSPVVRDLTERLAARKSDAQQVEDQLFELRDQERYLRLQEQSNRPLDAEAVNFLSRFDQKYSEVEEELKQLREDIFTLQDKLNDHNDVLFQTTRFDQDPGAGSATTEPVSIVLEIPPQARIDHRPDRAGSEDWEMVESFDQDCFGQEPSRDTLNWSFHVSYFVNRWLEFLLDRSRTQLMGCSASERGSGTNSETVGNATLINANGDRIAPSLPGANTRDQSPRRRTSVPARFLYSTTKSLPSSNTQNILTIRDALRENSMWAHDSDIGGFLFFDD